MLILNLPIYIYLILVASLIYLYIDTRNIKFIIYYLFILIVSSILFDWIGWWSLIFFVPAVIGVIRIYINISKSIKK